MINVREAEQDKLWESILTLANIDQDQAKVVFKAAIERSLRHIGMYTPFVAEIPLVLPDTEHIELLKDIEKQINFYLMRKEENKAYELVVDYIDVLSDLTETDSKIIRRRLLASLIGSRKVASPKIMTPSEDEPSFYSPKEAARRLGVSDQTVRRMCDKGKFLGAYQTDGGHWKIPKDIFITTEEQDREAEQLFKQIDAKNKGTGAVDEFDL